MTRKNPYRKNTHLSIAQIRKIIRYFGEDLTATTTSKLLRIERKTINWRYHYLREIIYYHSIQTDKEVWDWIIEIDESYFWPRRVRWKRWRWAGWKVKVLGLLKRWWQVYVQIVPDCSARTLVPIIRGKVSLQESIINSDYWTSYDGLVDMWAQKHHRVKHSENEFAKWPQHVNWIESFRSYCKRRLAKFNWVNKQYFILHLKETERRFNCWLQHQNKYKYLLKLSTSFTSSL